jgi:hypothetical protein
MNKFVLTTILLTFSFILSQGKTNQWNKNTNNAEQAESLKGSKFMLKYQAFASHDKEGTNIDTVKNEGDYIIFSENGTAYMYFKGKYDSIHFDILGKNEVSFGDTPFVVKNLGNGYFTLYQNEEEPNGDYNRVTYYLKEDNNYKQISYSK